MSLESTVNKSSETVKPSNFWNSLLETKSIDRNGKIYEMLGVKLWNKYYPNGGSRFSIYRCGIYSASEGNNKKEKLQDFIRGTKFREKMHWVGAPITTAVTISSIFLNHPLEGIICSAICTIYPIMAQRYNRARAEPLLEKLENRQS